MRTQKIREMEKRVEMYRKLLIWNIVFLLGLLCWGSVRGQFNNTKIKKERIIGGSRNDDLLNVYTSKTNSFILVCSSYSDSSYEKSNNNCKPSLSNDGAANAWIVKTDSLGNIIWDKTFGGNDIDVLSSIVSNYEKEFFLSGYSNSNLSCSKSQNSLGRNDFWVVKIDSNGNKLWDKSYGGDSNDYNTGLVEINNNTYLASGYTYSDSSGNKLSKKIDTQKTADFWAIKFDKNGNKIWDKSFGGFNNDICNSSQKINSNEFWLIGQSHSDSTGNKTSKLIGNIYDAWIISIDSNGNKLWDKSFGSQFLTTSFIYSKNFNQNNYLIKSVYYGFNGFTIDSGKIVLVKINSSGNQVWEKVIINSPYSRIGNIEIDSLDNIYYSIDNPNYTSYNIINKVDKNGSLISSFSIWNEGNGQFLSLSDDKLSHIFTTTFDGFDPKGERRSKNHEGSTDIWFTILGEPKHQIKGSVFPDFNTNCLYNKPNEVNFPNVLVHNKTENTYAITNDSIYTMYLFDRDTAVLKIINLDSNLYVSCGKDSIVVDMTGKTDTSGIDFPIRSNKTGHCINITSFSSGLLRPGRWGDYQLNYQNNAFDTAYNAYIEIELDTVTIDSIKSPYSFTLTGTILRFNLGHVRPFGFSSMTYSIKLKTSVIIGSSHCHRAKVFPICNLYPSAVYDSSEIQPMMRCLSNDTVEFTLKNIGLRDQKDWGHSIIYVDELILKKDSFKLTVGNSRVFKYKLDTNKVFTAEVFNSNFHPVTPILIRHNDLCANRRPMIPQNAALNFSRHDEAKEYEEACTIVRGSYDPNMKSVLPVGMFSQHYTATGTELKYRLDFQNTGTDTAFKVVLIDTLSADLDIASFVPGASSHPYSIEFGGRAVKFIFDPIALVDSFKNEPLSHGYVCFKIKHKNGIAPKTKIENFVDIYFDYNAPVRTNTVFNTIFDTIQIYVPKGGSAIAENDKTSVIVFPNPSTDKFFIQMSEPVKDLSIEIYDMQGRLIKTASSSNNQTVEVSVEGMTKGIYHIRCMSGEKLIVVKKVMVE